MTLRHIQLFGLTVLVLAAGTVTATKMAHAQSLDTAPVGTRFGLFVKTDQTMTDLLNDGYDLKAFSSANADTYLLQKDSSLFSCVAIASDSERTYCVQLSEKK